MCRARLSEGLFVKTKGITFVFAWYKNKAGLFISFLTKGLSMIMDQFKAAKKIIPVVILAPLAAACNLVPMEKPVVTAPQSIATLTQKFAACAAHAVDRDGTDDYRVVSNLSPALPVGSTDSAAFALTFEAVQRGEAVITYSPSTGRTAITALTSVTDQNGNRVPHHAALVVLDKAGKPYAALMTTQTVADLAMYKNGFSAMFPEGQGKKGKQAAATATVVKVTSVTYPERDYRYDMTYASGLSGRVEVKPAPRNQQDKDSLDMLLGRAAGCSNVISGGKHPYATGFRLPDNPALRSSFFDRFVEPSAR